MPAAVPTGLRMLPVTITYSSPGAQPPIFIAGDFSEIPWEPRELDVVEANGSDLLFSKTFHLPEGEYQYKFRLGTGDWWVCDTSKEIVTDEAGMQNNRLIVRPESRQDNFDGEGEIRQITPKDLTISEHPPQDKSLPTGIEHELAAAKEAVDPVQKQPSVQANDTPSSAAGTHPDSSRSNPGKPLNRGKPAMNVAVKPTNKQVEDLKARFHNRGNDPYADVGGDFETPLHDSGAPLLPHEMGASPPTPPAEEELRYPFPGGAAPAPSRPARVPTQELPELERRRSSRVPLAPTPEDYNDPTVEKFPESRAGILQRIQTLKQELPEDESRELEEVMTETSSYAGGSPVSAFDIEGTKSASATAVPEALLPEPAMRRPDTITARQKSSQDQLTAVPEEYEEPTSFPQQPHAEPASAGARQRKAAEHNTAMQSPISDGTADERGATERDADRHEFFPDSSSSRTGSLDGNAKQTAVSLWTHLVIWVASVWDVIKAWFVKEKTE